MMTGTSGRSALALGKSSSPLIPGMLMSERIKMSDTPCRIGDPLKCGGGGLGKLHGEAASAEVVPELLPEQDFDIRLIVDHENEQVHARSPDSIQGRPRPRQNDPKFSEHSGLRIDLYGPTMLLDDDVVTDGTGLAQSLHRRAWS